MDFSLTEEHQMIRDAARDFAQTELLPGVIERDNKQEFPQELVKKIGRFRFYGINGGSKIRRKRNGCYFLCVGDGRTV
jgi:alkylation response protein AidB-like acyl-CoA dehydrogenase